MRDAFGRLLSSPATLPRIERIGELRRQAARLQAEADASARWLGACLARWLASGGDFAEAVGIKPERGSRATAPALLAQERADLAIVGLATAARSDRLALAWVRGESPPPVEHAGAVAEARELGVPAGPHAVCRARARLIATAGMRRSCGQWAAPSTDDKGCSDEPC